MADRTTKLLLLAIAVGLWMNVASQWLRPVPVHAAVETAQASAFDAIASDVSLISSRLGHIVSDVSFISAGVCLNPKIY